MDRIEEIRDKIGQCDDNIIEQLVARMRCIQDIIEYKKEKGIPILQPEQEKKQEDNLKRKLGDVYKRQMQEHTSDAQDHHHYR